LKFWIWFCALHILCKWQAAFKFNGHAITFSFSFSYHESVFIFVKELLFTPTYMTIFPPIIMHAIYKNKRFWKPFLWFDVHLVYQLQQLVQNKHIGHNIDTHKVWKEFWVSCMSKHVDCDTAFLDLMKKDGGGCGIDSSLSLQLCKLTARSRVLVSISKRVKMHLHFTTMWLFSCTYNHVTYHLIYVLGFESSWYIICSFAPFWPPLGFCASDSDLGPLSLFLLSSLAGSFV